MADKVKEFTVTYDLTEAQVEKLEQLTNMYMEKSGREVTPEEQFDFIMVFDSHQNINKRLDYFLDRCEKIIPDKDRMS